MSRTFAAAALGLPALRSIALPELEGTALRLHVAPVVTARWPSGDRGYALLTLAPGDDPDEPAALVRLPLMQVEALERATAAFNAIMSAADRAEMLSRKMRALSADLAASCESSALNIGPAEPHPVALARFSARESSAPTAEGITPPPPAASRTQSLITAAAQVAMLAGLLPAVAARCLGLL